MSETVPASDAFARSAERFGVVVSWLGDAEAGRLAHADLEDRLQGHARELFCALFQDHLDLRALTERRTEVRDDAGLAHATIEVGHERVLTTIFGEVTVSRIAYRRRGHENLRPADAQLNLPSERHSHGLRRLAAIESSRGSFDGATEAIYRATGVKVAKRQVEALTARAGVDFAAFYARHPRRQAADGDVLVLSMDGKGVVMRPDALRKATAKAAAETENKLESRLSRGEKRYRKRMAEVGAVYDLTPVPRTAGQILTHHDDDTSRPAVQKAANKWVIASVVDDAKDVIGQVFSEADRRDPGHHRNWVALVDGNAHQINCIETEAKAREIAVPIVIDFVHVLEYLWKAVWCFYAEGDRAVEAWVGEKALALLRGDARQVAASIRRKATALGLTAPKRKGADVCATYLTNKADYLDYPTALAKGWPIASGVIEGTCRYLVADRMDITGARWSVDGAEAVLKLRAIRANGDFEEYFAFHLNEEQRRLHRSRFENGTIPQAA